LLFCCILLSTLPVHAQETITEPAEVVGTLTDPKIPSIKTAEWTTINLTILDGYGIPWANISKNMPILSKYIWPIIFPSWKNLLGYSALRFEPEIIDGDPRGWYTKITPSAIATADQGKIYNLKLEVKTDDIAVDYAVVVGVKVTRVAPSGEDIGVSYVNIPVKASPFNNLKMTAGFTTKETSPRSHVTIDISLTNRGYYRDMFSLKFVEESGATIFASQQVIVLDPEETQQVRIDILTPEKFFDLGTPNIINIYATSISDPNPAPIGSFVIVTKGFYFSPLIGIVLIPIILIIVIIFLFWFFIKERRDIEHFGKPQKPWNILEEKTYLQDLKQDDKKAYALERQMMKDEYKSSMLWYRDYRKAMKQESIKEEPTQKETLGKKLSGLFKKPKTTSVQKEKPKKKSSILLKKSPEKPKKEVIKPIVPVEDTRKEEAIAKKKKRTGKTTPNVEKIIIFFFFYY
jgi:uncharacterized membrane protein